MRPRALTFGAEISIKKIFRQMVLVFFSHRNQEWDRVVTIYKIPVNFWLSLERKPFTGNQTNGKENFSRSGSQSEKKLIPRKAGVLPFFPNIPPG